jgi:hypothetical protein
MSAADTTCRDGTTQFARSRKLSGPSTVRGARHAGVTDLDFYVDTGADEKPPQWSSGCRDRGGPGRSSAPGDGRRSPRLFGPARKTRSRRRYSTRLSRHRGFNPMGNFLGNYCRQGGPRAACSRRVDFKKPQLRPYLANFADDREGIKSPSSDVGLPRLTWIAVQENHGPWASGWLYGLAQSHVVV